MPPTRPVALITGSSRGLGRELALAYARKGYVVAINFKNSKDAAQTVASQIEKDGGSAHVFQADVTRSGDVGSMVEKIAASFGRIDVLVNNAGTSRDQLISKMTDEEWQSVLDSNLNSVFYCTRAVLPLMRKQKSGSIINITSYTAPRGARGAANYAAAKAGVISFTKSTALEEGRYGIRANAFMPGFHVTDINRSVWDRFEKEIRAQHTLEKMPERTEMADFAVHVSELTSVSGQIFSFESRLS